MKKTFSVSVFCKDAVFARMLELELSQNGFNVKSGLSGADTALLDLDSAEKGIFEKLMAGKLPVIAFSRENYADSEKNGENGKPFVFLRRPFLISELTDALEKCRRTAQSENSAEKSGKTLSVKAETDGSVSINGEQIPLSDTEAALLRLLLEKNGEPLSKKDAMAALWKDASPDSNVYDVYIHYLREKIDERFNVKFIKTVREKGYKINN